MAPSKLQTLPLSNGFPSSSATPHRGWRGGSRGGGRDLQRFPCALDLKVSVSVNLTSNGHGLLLALWSGGEGGIRAEYRPLPRHVTVQNGFSSGVKTAPLKVFWEWHKIKAEALSLSHHSYHTRIYRLSFITHTVIKVPLSLLFKAQICFYIKNYSCVDVFQA